MSRGINKVILVGRLGNDPETRYLPSGSAVTNISVATSETWKDKQSGEKQERTEWHKVIFFNRLAEIAGEYLRKGGLVYIEGSLRTNQWEKDGVKRYSTEIIASSMQMLGDGPGQEQSSQPQRQEPAQSRAQQPQNKQPSNSKSESNSFDDFDDDIPF